MACARPVAGEKFSTPERKRDDESHSTSTNHQKKDKYRADFHIFLNERVNSSSTTIPSSSSQSRLGALDRGRLRGQIFTNI